MPAYKAIDLGFILEAIMPKTSLRLALELDKAAICSFRSSVPGVEGLDVINTKSKWAKYGPLRVRSVMIPIQGSSDAAKIVMAKNKMQMNWKICYSL